MGFRSRHRCLWIPGPRLRCSVTGLHGPLDLELAHPLRRTSFVFAEGGTQAPVVQLPRLQLGALFVDDVSVGILSLPPGLGVDGLLGMDVYQRLGIRRLTLELDTAALVLRR